MVPVKGARTSDPFPVLKQFAHFTHSLQMATNFWSFFLRKKSKDSGTGSQNVYLTRVARYNPIVSPESNIEETRLWTIPTPELDQARAKQYQQPRLQRRANNRGKIRREDLVNVLGGRNDATRSAPDLFEDETIPGKAIVFKMPERSMKTYFIPLPIDLEVYRHCERR